MRKGESDADFCLEMAEKVGVACVPGTSFFNENINHIVRVHFAKKDETLYEALERLSHLKGKKPTITKAAASEPEAALLHSRCFFLTYYPDLILESGDTHEGICNAEWIGEVGWVEKPRPVCGPLDRVCRPLAAVVCTSDAWSGRAQSATGTT